MRATVVTDQAAGTAGMRMVTQLAREFGAYVIGTGRAADPAQQRVFQHNPPKSAVPAPNGSPR